MSVFVLKKSFGTSVILSSNSRMITGMFSVSSMQNKCFQTKRFLLEIGTLPICLSFYLSTSLWRDEQELIRYHIA